MTRGHSLKMYSVNKTVKMESMQFNNYYNVHSTKKKNLKTMVTYAILNNCH